MIVTLAAIDEPIEEILKVKEQYESSMPNLQKRSKAAEAKVNRKRMDVEKVRAVHTCLWIGSESHKRIARCVLQHALVMRTRVQIRCLE